MRPRQPLRPGRPRRRATPAGPPDAAWKPAAGPVARGRVLQRRAPHRRQRRRHRRAAALRRWRRHAQVAKQPEPVSPAWPKAEGAPHGRDRPSPAAPAARGACPQAIGWAAQASAAPAQTGAGATVPLRRGRRSPGPQCQWRTVRAAPGDAAQRPPQARPARSKARVRRPAAVHRATRATPELPPSFPRAARPPADCGAARMAETGRGRGRRSPPRLRRQAGERPGSPARTGAPPGQGPGIQHAQVSKAARRQPEPAEPAARAERAQRSARRERQRAKGVPPFPPAEPGAPSRAGRPRRRPASAWVARPAEALRRTRCSAATRPRLQCRSSGTRAEAEPCRKCCRTERRFGRRGCTSDRRPQESRRNYRSNLTLGAGARPNATVRVWASRPSVRRATAAASASPHGPQTRDKADASARADNAASASGRRLPRWERA